MPPPPPQLSEAQFFAVLQAMEDYLAAQEGVGSALRQGLLDLARSKYALGALGQQQYPGHMQASALVVPQAPPAAGPDGADSLYSQFELEVKHQQQQQQEHQQQQHEQQQQGAHERSRGQQEAAKGSAAASAGTDPQQQQASGQDGHDPHHQRPQHGSSTDPVAWFSALPPAQLKAAQGGFRGALQQAVAAANALQRLRQRLEEVGEEAGAGADGGDAAS